MNEPYYPRLAPRRSRIVRLNTTDPRPWLVQHAELPAQTFPDWPSAMRYAHLRPMLRNT